jgi:hypothetical protein
MANLYNHKKMLPTFYQTFLSEQLNRSDWLMVQTLVWLLQLHKTVKIERLAACFPLGIKQESRRRRIQRFLVSTSLSVPLLWFPLVQILIHRYFPKNKPIYVALDRTSWKQNNLFMGSVIYQKRAWPVYWTFIDQTGASNLARQKALLTPIIRLLNGYKIIGVGDREFHSVELAKWLQSKKVYFALRQKCNTYIKQSRKKGEDFESLSGLGLQPGMKLYLPSVQFTKKKGFGRYALAAYWKRKYGSNKSSEPWYILTNLPDLKSALKAYSMRMGIEAMFKDCKTGGYNLEGTGANQERLTRLVLLIALAYTASSIQGVPIKQQGVQSYVARLTEPGRSQRRHSNFWIGLYGLNWIDSMEKLQELSIEFMKLHPHKRPFYRRGLRAMSLIQSSF